MHAAHITELETTEIKKSP